MTKGKKGVGFHSRKRLTSLLVKPAGPDCNMDCHYCFYLKKSSLFEKTRTHRMREDVLEELVKQALRQGEKSFNFSWQGGEPTLMGLAFYRKAVELEEKYGQGKEVGNGFQTNGLLLDKEWADFLAKYRFLVGLSLDGPEHIHNKYRRFRSGEGSWAKTVDKAKLLLDRGVAVNVLTVIHDYSVNFPEEIYAFHKSLGLRYMQFIPCLEPDPADPRRPAPFSVSPEKYGQFLCRLFNLWMNDFEGTVATTSIRLFDSLFHLYVGLPPPECTLLKECGVYLVIEHNGDVFACDFFVDPDWKLGNILQNRLQDMLNSSRQRKFGKRKTELPEDCQKCRWLRYCRGGCPKDRFPPSPGGKTNFFCSSIKTFLDHADRHFQKLARAWKSASLSSSPG